MKRRIALLGLLVWVWCYSVQAQHKVPFCFNSTTGTTGSNVAALANSNNNLFFQATILRSGQNIGIEPYIGGCSNGAIRVGNIMNSPSGSGSNPYFFTYLNGSTYYHAKYSIGVGPAAETRTGLVRTAMTNQSPSEIGQGLTEVKQFTTSNTPHSLSNHHLFGGMVRVGNNLYFAAQSNSLSSPYDMELWQSDGTTAGTLPTPAINTTSIDITTVPHKNGCSFPQNLTPIKLNGEDFLFFTADDSFVQRQNVISESVIDTLGNRELYFRKADWPAATPSVKVEINNQPLTYSGTCSGTSTSYVCNYTVSSWAGSVPANITAYKNKVYCIATNNGLTGLTPTSGDKLWSVDASGNLAQIMLNGGAIPDRKSPMVVSNNLLYFVAHSPSTGRELWKYDGVNAMMVQDLNPTGDGVIGAITTPHPLNVALANTVLTFNMVDINNTLYLAANNGVTGIELYQTDGATIKLVSDKGVADAGNIHKDEFGIISSYPRKMVNVNGVLYFFIRNILGQPEVWRYVPTNACNSSFQQLSLYHSYPLPAVGASESQGTSPGLTKFGSITEVGNDFYYLVIDSSYGSGSPEVWYAESCATATLTYSDACKSPTVTTATPTVTFAKTSLQACAPAVTTPADICPGGDCFCSATLPETALNKKTGVINLNDTGATLGTHKICYHNPAESCILPVCYTVTIQVATSAAFLVETVAGSGTTCSDVVSVPSPVTPATHADACFNFGNSLNVDDANISVALSPDGSKVYVADEFDNMIRQVDIATNTLTKIAGNGAPSNLDNANGLNAFFKNPSGLTTDGVGNIYVADKGNHIIRKINIATSAVTTVAGVKNLISGGYVNNNNPLLAQFSQPTDVVLDNAGNIYVSDKNNHAIRKIAPTGAVTTLAGGNGVGSLNGAGSVAQFNYPSGMDIDEAGNIYVADKGNHAIRKIAPDGTVTTIAGNGTAGNVNGVGTSATFKSPTEVTVSVLGKLYVADAQNYVIREINIATGAVSTYAGTGSVGTPPIPPATVSIGNALFNLPVGITEAPDGRLYITDKLNARIRVIKENTETGGKINQSQTACSGSNVTLTLVDYPGTPNPAGIARWERSTDSGTTWTALPSSAGKAVYTFNNIAATSIFRVIVSEASCGIVKSSIATVTVIVPPTPIVANVAVCGTNPATNVNATLTATGGVDGEYRWYDNSDGLLPALGQNGTASVQVSVTTTFKVSLVRAGCESVKVPVTVTVYPPPTPVVAGSISVCPNISQPYSTTANTGFRYKWEITVPADGAGSNITQSGTLIYEADNANAINVIWANTGTTPIIGTIKVTETSPAPASCSTTSTIINVTINPLPAVQVIAPASPTGDALCAGKMQNYNVNNTGNTFAWTRNPTSAGSLANANTNSVDFTADANVTSNTTVTLSCVETTAAGCTRTHTRVITVNPLPVVQTITGSAVPCLNAPQTYGIAQVGSNTYTWTVEVGTATSMSGTGTSFPTTFTAIGAARVCVTETNPTTGCFVKYCKDIDVKDLPVAQTITGSIVPCLNTPQTYSVTQVGSNTYAWTVEVGTASTMSGTGISFNPTFTAIGAARVCVTETNPTTTCFVKYCKDIDVKDLPAVQTIVGATTVCKGKAYPYSVTNTGNTFVWTSTPSTGVTISNASSANTDITWNTIGAYTVQLKETNGSNCERNNTLIVNVIDIPATPTISPATPTCAGSTVTYTATGGSGIFQWDINNNGTPTNPTGNTVTVTWANSTTAFTGILKVKEIGVAPTNCESLEATQNITVNPLPAKQTIIGNTSVCKNSTHAYAVPNTAGSTYQWKLNGTNIASTNPANITWTTGGTLTVEETDANGCKQIHDNAPTPFVVQVIDVPTPVITGAQNNICPNTSSTYTIGTPNSANTYTWTVTGGNTFPSSGANTVSGLGLTTVAIQWVASGTITVVETTPAPASCAGTSAVFSVTITPNPTPQAVTGVLDVCPATTTTYSVANNPANTFTWTVEGGGMIDGTLLTKTGVGLQSISVTWGTNTGTTIIIGKVTVVETTPAPSNCPSAPSSVNVNIHPTPVAQSIVGSATSCQGKTETYNVPNNPLNKFKWIITGGKIMPDNVTTKEAIGLQSISVTWDATATTGKVELAETTPPPASCGSASSVLNVIVNPTPKITGITASISGAVCGKTQVTYTATGENLAGATFQWNTVSNGTAVNLTTNPLVVTWNDVATLTTVTLGVKATSPAPASCESTIFTQDITINPLPADRTITGASPVCLNSTENYSVVSTAGNTYTWKVEPASLASVSAGTGNTASINWVQQGVATLSFEEIVTATGCKKTHTKTVNVNVTPTVTVNDIIGNTTVCNVGQSTFSINNPNNYTVEWDIRGGVPAPGFTINSNPITIDWTGSPISIAVKLSAGSCEATSPAKPVTGVSAPTVTFTPINGEVCIGGCIAFIAPDAPVGQTYEYLWTTNGGDIQGANNAKTVMTCWNVSNGTEYVRLTITIAGTNCSNISPLPASPTDLGFVKVNPLPTPDITGDNLVCPNETATYTTPNVAGHTYLWSVTGTGNTPPTATSNSYAITWGATAGQTYIITLKETITATGCFKEDTMHVRITPAPAMPTSPDRYVCNPPKMIDLSAMEASASSYAWYNVATGGSPIATTQIYSVNVTANVSYWVSAINAAGCESERKEVKIIVNPADTDIVITAVITNAEECVASGDSPSGSINLTVQGNNGTFTYAWTKVGTAGVIATTEDLINITKGNYQVTVTDAGGCTKVSPVYPVLEQLKLLTNPEIVYGGKVLADNEEITVGLSVPVVLKAQATDAETFEWTNNYNTEVKISPNCEFIPTALGTYIYTVKITNSKKCSALRRVVVKVAAISLFVPNFFSPNSDNNNDKLQVHGNGIKSVNFKIYNRLGKVVYETNQWVEGNPTDADKDKGWDGYYQGRLQETGNYTWLLSVTYINDTTEKKTGNVLLK